MPPVLGPVSPSPTRLWSWAEASATARGAVDQREQAGFLAFQEFLDHHRPVAGRADRGLGLVAGHGDGDALAGGEAVGLDHHRDRKAVERGQRIGLGLDPDVGGGRDSGARAEILGEALGAFELGGGGAGAEGGDAGGSGGVGDARRPAALRGRRRSGRCRAPWPARPRLAGSQGSIATHSAQRAMPGLPGAAISASQLGDCFKPPCQRIFAPARTQQQDVHASPRRPRCQPAS